MAVQTDASPAVELATFLRTRPRRLAIVALVPLVAIGGAWLLSSSRPSSQDAAVTVVVPAVGPDVVGSLPATESFRSLVTGPEATRRAGAEAELAPALVRERLRAVQQGRGNLVEVRFRHRDGRVAATVVSSAVQVAFDRLFAVERDAARRWAESAAARAQDAEGIRVAAEATAAEGRVAARIDASVAQLAGLHITTAPRSTQPVARAAAASLLLAGIALAGWERIRPFRPGPAGAPGRSEALLGATARGETRARVGASR